MHVLRTPEERFASLPEFAFAPHYEEISDGDGGTLRVHYLDEGPRQGELVLLLHGDPSWSFLYRKMIPVLVEAGYRCVAPDLVGFGRSDKPSSTEDHTYARHVEWMRATAFDALDLRDITLVCQDWGGLIGLRLVAEHPERFARVVAANTGMPTGHEPMSKAFLAWQRYSQEVPQLPIGGIVASGCVTPLSPDVVAAYDAPFPDESYKAGARKFSVLVPTTPDDPASKANQAAWESLAHFDRPFLTAFSDSDPITRGADVPLRERIPGAVGQPHTTIHGARHFLQEDKGPELAAVVVNFMRGTVAEE